MGQGKSRVSRNGAFHPLGQVWQPGIAGIAGIVGIFPWLAVQKCRRAEDASVHRCAGGVPIPWPWHPVYGAGRCTAHHISSICGRSKWRSRSTLGHLIAIDVCSGPELVMLLRNPSYSQV